MTATLSDASGADLIGALPALSTAEIMAGLGEDFGIKAAADGRIVARLGELDRRQAYRDEGATSLESWTAERFGISTATARALAHVGEEASNLPHLVGSLCAGEISFDKLRALADVATPETDRELCDQAVQCTVRELADLARTRARPTTAPGRSGHERRSLRFNDAFCTMTVQLAPEAYAETKACLEARARLVPSDGETPWDQRRCDAFLAIIRSAGAGGASAATPYFVVAHVPLLALVEESGQCSHLAAELELGGLIDGHSVQRVACDATVAIAVDDDVGHTMYEGRARRFPTNAQRREVRRRDRACRFPGCANVTFTNVHHIVAWKPGGRTDLDNLALVCEFHHHLVHSKGWTMSGNANEELTFLGPSGRVMTSRPSPLWTRVTGGRGSGGGPPQTLSHHQRARPGRAPAS